MDAVTLPVKWQEWKIVEALGEGNFGTVYRAEKDDGVVKSVSAIKLVEIAADSARMAGLSRRYRSEAALREYLWSVVDHCAEEIRTMYRLQGESSIVSIQDHAIEALEGRIGWRLFIRMEYLQSFNDYLTTHEFTQRDIIRMGISLCGALEKCEKLNILHRDIKPENIFVSSSGAFKLGDFGISRVLEETRASLTSEGTFGTIAPEAYKGQPCGKEADIYSLGLVLYTILLRPIRGAFRKRHLVRDRARQRESEPARFPWGVRREMDHRRGQGRHAFHRGRFLQPGDGQSGSGGIGGDR